MKKSTLIIAVLLVAVVAYVGLSGSGLSVLGGGTQVNVTISQQLLDDGEALGIDYVTLSFYASTDEGNVLVATERIDMVASQTIHVSGLNQGSISIVASLPDGDSAQVHATGDGHVASGQGIQIVFESSTNPYWNVI